MLVDFCTQNNLCIINTWYEHNLRKRYTWKAPGDIRRQQIDYIMVKHRYRNSVKNACSLPGTDIDSAHNAVMMKIAITLKEIKKEKKVITWNTEILKGTKKIDYIEGVNDKIRANKTNRVGVQDKWAMIKEAILDSARKNIGSSIREAKKPWVMDMLQKREEQRKWKNIRTAEGKECYRKLTNELRRETDKARKNGGPYNVKR